uniref:Uncharacterized protein n=1 Tax=Sphaerodactylus townsendi TaxID=933632 RepID=A0ACB8FD42_9SAUR
MVLVGAAAGKVATAAASFLLRPALPPTPLVMPKQKSNKGKKNKRANSSGDEQENGALAAAVVAASGETTDTIGALDAVATARAAMVLVGAAAGKVATAAASFLLRPALPPTPLVMPKQKSNKGKKNKRANSSGDQWRS